MTDIAETLETYHVALCHEAAAEIRHLRATMAGLSAQNKLMFRELTVQRQQIAALTHPRATWLKLWPTEAMYQACERVWNSETPVDAKTAPIIRRKAYREMILAAAQRVVMHVKRGSFYRVAYQGAELQSEAPIAEGPLLTVYLAENGKVWVRPDAEFEDGRFQDVPAHV